MRYAGTIIRGTPLPPQSRRNVTSTTSRPASGRYDPGPDFLARIIPCIIHVQFEAQSDIALVTAVWVGVGPPPISLEIYAYLINYSYSAYQSSLSLGMIPYSSHSLGLI